MKKIILPTFIFMLSTNLNLLGQSLISTKIDLKLSTKTATPRLRNTGIGFLCFGIATIGGGAAMVSSADGVTYYSATNYGTEGSFIGAMGSLGIVGGSISTAGGAIMTYFGVKKLKKSKATQQTVTVNVTPFSGKITYHF